MSRATDIAYELLKKEAWAGKAISGTLRGLNRVGQAISNQLAEAGVQSDTAHVLAKASPYIVAGLAANKVRKSETYQRLKEKAKRLFGKGEQEYNQ
jgi:hypothetical protein